jgi:hypothetical protein
MKLLAKVGTSHIYQIWAEEATKMSGEMPLLSSFMMLIMQLAVQDWIPLH